MESMKAEPHPSEYDAFTSLVDRVLSVPHDVIKKRVEQEQRLQLSQTDANKFWKKRMGPFRKYWGLDEPPSQDPNA